MEDILCKSKDAKQKISKLVVACKLHDVADEVGHPSWLTRLIGDISLSLLEDQPQTQHND